MPSGTKSLDFTNRLGEYESGVGDTAGLIGGWGTSSSMIGDDGVADKNFIQIWTKSTATSGDCRGIYWGQNFNAAGSGEVARLRAVVNYNGAAAGGTINAMHATLAINTSSAISGQGSAIRATLEAAAATRTLGGALSALIVDSYIGANNTMPTIHGFIRFANVGDVALSNLLVLPSTASNGTVLATHTTQAMTHSIRIIDSAGTPYYIMCTNAATNRD